MTRSFLLPAALAAVVLAAAAPPAAAVAIHHTSRVDGDPDAPRPAAHGTPPADTAGQHYFDKSHESGTRG